MRTTLGGLLEPHVDITIPSICATPLWPSCWSNTGMNGMQMSLDQLIAESPDKDGQRNVEKVDEVCVHAVLSVGQTWVEHIFWVRASNQPVRYTIPQNERFTPRAENSVSIEDPGIYIYTHRVGLQIVQITKVVWTLSSSTCRSSSSEHAIGSTWHCQIHSHYVIIPRPIRQRYNSDTSWMVYFFPRFGSFYAIMVGKCPKTYHTWSLWGACLSSGARSGPGKASWGTALDLPSPRKYDNDAPSPVECDVELGDLQPEPGRLAGRLWKIWLESVVIVFF